MIRRGALVTVGRVADLGVPTYLVAWCEPAQTPGGEGRWQWVAMQDGRPRTWLTLAAAEAEAWMTADATDGGPAVILNTDRVPPPPGVEPGNYQMPHCRVIRLVALGDVGHPVEVGELPGLDHLGRLIHELYHPMPDDRREAVPSVDSAPQG